jgi:dihydropteroate synthase
LLSFSFSDGGRYFQNPQKAVSEALEMIKAGAQIIDIGGESTRPYAETVDCNMEIERIIHVIK